jgi:hypothetical protein
VCPTHNQLNPCIECERLLRCSLVLQEILSPPLVKAALPSTVSHAFFQALARRALSTSDADKDGFVLSADEELCLIQGALLRLEAAVASENGAVLPPSLSKQLERIRQAKLEQAVREYDGQVKITGVRLVKADDT